MKKHILIALVWSLYRCEIEVDYFSQVRKSTRWKFKLHPRKLQMTVIYLVLTPFVFIKSGYCGVIEGWAHAYDVQSWFVFIKSGYCGVIEGWAHAYDVQSWSSYSIWSNEMPSKFECYSRF